MKGNDRAGGSLSSSSYSKGVGAGNSPGGELLLRDRLVLLGLVTFIWEIGPGDPIPRVTLLALRRLLGLAESRVSRAAGGEGNGSRISASFVIRAGAYRRGSN